MKKTYYCPKCNTPITRTPTSNYIDGSKLVHIPHFGRAQCTNCGWKSGFYEYGLVQGKNQPTDKKNN